MEQEFVSADSIPEPLGDRVTMVGYRSSGQPTGIHLGVPSATLTFILSLDGPVVAAASATDLATGRAAAGEILLSGLHERAAFVAQPSHQEGLQLAVDPLAARALFGAPASALSESVTESWDLSHWGRELWQRVGEARSWEDRFQIVSAALSRRLADDDRSGSGPRPEVVHAWRLLARTRGSVAVDDLTRAVALSGRQLRDEFRREIGISPKAVARLMRFEHAMARLTAGVRAERTPQLAAVAATCGYADQAHLSREFRAYLGVPPSVWLEQERRNIQAGGHSYRGEWSA